jgi:site-specific DNA-methyltransferase (adenine-specific)|tara:strand:- start:915 stop:1511 length:597 start_codon:yes stop_codon:yes gene_type:complete
MNIQQIDISLIKPYDKNPRKIPDKAIGLVAQSIKNFGWQQPIVVDKQNIIVVGHTRYEAAKQLGINKVPIQIADLNEEQAKAYRIADNRVNEETGWNYNFLQDELNVLMAKEVDLNLTGFSSSELDSMFNKEIVDTIDETQDEVDSDNEMHILNDVKMIQLFFSPEKEQIFREKIQQIKNENNIDNISDAVFYALTEK